jgi:RimJ/RimL family protein N-acetyltransferase
MNLNVSEMKLEEVGIIIGYFHRASPEHLEILGVDPTRLPDADKWRDRYTFEYSQPMEKRRTFLVVWKLDDDPIGFSTADKIVYGEEAYMHLHIVKPHYRTKGLGSECVRKTAKLYFAALKLQRLFCEPNAFNVAPNRTLQKAGFRYVKTHKTVPGPLNYYQAVTRWVLEGTDL